jgi:hypothetical protein
MVHRYINCLGYSKLDDFALCAGIVIDWKMSFLEFQRARANRGKKGSELLKGVGKL